MSRKKKAEEPVVNEAPKKKPGRPKKSDAEDTFPLLSEIERISGGRII